MFEGVLSSCRCCDSNDGLEVAWNRVDTCTKKQVHGTVTCDLSLGFILSVQGYQYRFRFQVLALACSIMGENAVLRKRAFSSLPVDGGPIVMVTILIPSKLNVVNYRAFGFVTVRMMISYLNI